MAVEPEDAILTIPQEHDIEDWRGFDEVYVPGSGQPRRTAVGRHLWLRHQGRPRLRAEILKIHPMPRRRERLGCKDRGSGWSFTVGEWERVDVTDADLGFDPGPASRGLRTSIRPAVGVGAECG
jgi:hypothetical protein